LTNRNKAKGAASAAPFFLQKTEIFDQKNKTQPPVCVHFPPENAMLLALEV